MESRSVFLSQKNNQEIFEALLSFIRENIDEMNAISSSVKEDSTPDIAQENSRERQVNAAILLQRMCRLQLLATTLFSTQGQEMYWDMLDQENPDTRKALLAKLMFGKTVAKVSPSENFPAEGVALKHKGEYDFPVRQHALWNSRYKQFPASYHRWSDLDQTLSKQIADLYLDHPDHSSNKYIPIIESNNASIECVIDMYLKNFSNLIEMIKKPNENIIILKIPLKEFDEVYDVIRSSGLVASPWDIARFFANKEEIKAKINDRQNNFEHPYLFNINDFFEHQPIIKKLLPTLPITLTALKEHSLMDELARIAISNRPTKILGACLHRLISAIDYENPESIQRISLFLSFAVKLHKNHYDKFAFSLYAIIHEISLLLENAYENGIEITNYKKFESNVHKNFISSFNLANEENANYITLAAPANSGAHAFLMAIEIAQKMKKKYLKSPHPISPHQYTEMEIIYGGLYYEFFKFTKKSASFNMEMNKELTDIYYLSTGPLLITDDNKTTVTLPGVDLNLFVRHLLDIGLEKRKEGVVIVVDTTTGMKKNLILNEATQKLISDGKISIICHESYQKFGMAHTDQLQGGVLYGIFSKQSFNEKDLIQFEKNAEKDLLKHFDMMMLSFIQEKVGHYLELIKHNHFKNGELINNFFMKSSCIDYMNFFTYNFMLPGSGESFFVNINKKNNAALYDAAFKNLDFRQGFGHYNTTVTDISTNLSLRLSAGASDKIDTIIQIVQLHLASVFRRDQLMAIVSEYLDKEKDGKLSVEQQIFYTGLLLAIKNLCVHPPQFWSEEREIFIQATKKLINHHTELLSGRKSVLTLYYFMIHPHFYIFNSPSAFVEYFKGLNENEKITMIQKIRSENIMNKIIIGQNSLYALMMEYPHSMRFDLVLEYSSLISSSSFFLKIMHSLAKNEKYAFVQHMMIANELQFALSHENLLTIITALPDKTDAFNLALAFTGAKEEVLNANTLILIAEFFKDNTAWTIQLLDKYINILKQNSVSDVNDQNIELLNETINLYRSIKPIIGQSMFDPVYNKSDIDLLKSEIEGLSKKIKKQILDYNNEITKEKNSYLYVNKDDIKLWNDKIAILEMSDKCLNGEVQGNDLDDIIESPKYKGWEKGEKAVNLVNEVKQLLKRIEDIKYYQINDITYKK